MEQTWQDQRSPSAACALHALDKALLDCPGTSLSSTVEHDRVQARPQPLKPSIAPKDLAPPHLAAAQVMVLSQQPVQTACTLKPTSLQP